jgi:hypothetical protein
MQDEVFPKRANKVPAVLIFSRPWDFILRLLGE